MSRVRKGLKSTPSSRQAALTPGCRSVTGTAVRSQTGPHHDHEIDDTRTIITRAWPGFAAPRRRSWVMVLVQFGLLTAVPSDRPAAGG